MTITFDHGGTVFAIARQLGIAPEELLDFSASINPLGPVPGVRESVGAAFDRLVHYPDSEAAELRDALARFHGVAPENVCVANGSTELIYLVPRLVAGKRGVIVAPPFSEYAKSLHRSGLEFEYFALKPEDGFALSLSDLEVCLGGGYDFLFLCNPGNPTGKLISIEEVAQVLEICKKTGTFLVLDEAFMDFCEDASAKRLVVEAGCGIVLRSMTKFYAMPGLRLGYALASGGIITRLAASREPWSVNTLAQVAGLASLADADYPTRTRDCVAAGRNRLMAELAALPGLRPLPSAANYILVETTGGLTAGDIRNRLLHEWILIRDCSSFAGLDSRFFRVAVRTREENDRLVESLGNILG